MSISAPVDKQHRSRTIAQRGNCSDLDLDCTKDRYFTRIVGGHGQIGTPQVQEFDAHELTIGNAMIALMRYLINAIRKINTLREAYADAHLKVVAVAGQHPDANEAVVAYGRQQALLVAVDGVDAPGMCCNRAALLS